MEQSREGKAWRLSGFPVLIIEIALVVRLILWGQSVPGLIMVVGVIAALLLATLHR